MHVLAPLMSNGRQSCQVSSGEPPSSQARPLSEKTLQFNPAAMGDSHPPTEPREGKEEDPFPLTERDRIGISLKDEDFELHTWEALKVVIGKQDIPPRHFTCLQWQRHKQTGCPYPKALRPSSLYYLVPSSQKGPR